MSTRRALLAVAPGVFPTVGITSHGAKKHPDATLLALCAQLADQQTEWQRLWAAVPDDADDGREIDAFEAYSDTVWPGSAGPAAELVGLTATTPEGIRAKAAAALALHQTGMYVDAQHEDLLDIMASALHDAAGACYRPVGEDAE